MTTAALFPAAAADPEPPAERRWVPVAILFGAWTVVGLFFSTRPHVYNLLLGTNNEFDIRNVIANLQDAYLWALFTIPILWLARRFKFNNRWWPVSLLVHLSAAPLFAWMCVEIDYAFYRMIAPEWDGPILTQFRVTFYLNMQWYFVLVGVGYAIEYYRGMRERQVQAARLQSQLARSQLEALKSQIQPHFLFNTLHSISELVHEDPSAADRMITRLGDLLRLTVDSAGTHEIPLRQEMTFLEAYLEIQRTRFQDTLSVEMDVDDAAMDALVPNLVLQPLVENAIRHGIAPRGGPGRIVVRARKEGEALRLEVRDDGAGYAPRAGGRQGVGVSNTRARLEQLYGGAHRFDIGPAEGGGTLAVVTLPFREAPPEEEVFSRETLARQLSAPASFAPSRSPSPEAA